MYQCICLYIVVYVLPTFGHLDDGNVLLFPDELQPIDCIRVDLYLA